METDIRIFDTLESTNITLEHLARNDAKEGTCVIAFSQNAGQGRSGRSFFSPEGGNLYMSLLLRPKDDKQTEYITVIAAVAVVEAIEECFGIKTGIKWVNDVFLDGKKAGGIIAKANDYGKSSMFVVLGIGINIHEAPDVPEDIRPNYISLLGKASYSGSREQNESTVDLAKAIIRIFSRYYEGGLFTEAALKYRRYSVVIGKKVEYIFGQDTIEAIVCDIDDTGAIVLDTGGKIKAFRDGEIRIVVKDM